MGLTSFTYQIKLIFSLKMENLLLLKQNVNNTEPKRSFSIVVSDNRTRLKTWFKPPVQLDKKKDYDIALINLETYYSFPNIDRSNNCFTYSPNLTHYGLILLFLRAVYSTRNEKKMTTMIKQTIRITSKYLPTRTH